MTAGSGIDISPHPERPASRRVALDMLMLVLERRQPFDQVLQEEKSFRALAGRDRAFVRMLTATTLRRCGQIDDAILKASGKAELPRPFLLNNLLRLAVTQLLFMSVPDYAVVDTAVRLAKDVGLERQKGFINAVLRHVAREGKAWVAVQDEARLNIPGWLMDIWIADYGPQVAAEIARSSLVEAPLDITLKDPVHAAAWAETLGGDVLPTGSVRRMSGGAVRELPGYEDGMWWVQDTAAAVPVRLFGDIAGETVIDICAAPGGKTAQLAASGARVLAIDRSTQRLKRLGENLRRLRLEKNVTVEAADATVWRPREPAARILLDVPCTATGTIRRHPDVMHLKTPRDMQGLMDVQARLLENAVQILAPGGTLIYCTCSLQKAEGESQIEKLLASGAPVARLPVTAAEIGGLDFTITEKGEVRFLPFHLAGQGGIDGFFISRLRKHP